jgi:hypothetical protein
VASPESRRPRRHSSLRQVGDCRACYRNTRPIWRVCKTVNGYRKGEMESTIITGRGTTVATSASLKRSICDFEILYGMKTAQFLDLYNDPDEELTGIEDAELWYESVSTLRRLQAEGESPPTARQYQPETHVEGSQEKKPPRSR